MKGEKNMENQNQYVKVTSKNCKGIQQRISEQMSNSLAEIEKLEQKEITQIEEIEAINLALDELKAEIVKLKSDKKQVKKEKGRIAADLRKKQHCLEVTVDFFNKLNNGIANKKKTTYVDLEQQTVKTKRKK